jgi:hypothetical protein
MTGFGPCYDDLEVILGDPVIGIHSIENFRAVPDG